MNSSRLITARAARWTASGLLMLAVAILPTLASAEDPSDSGYFGGPVRQAAGESRGPSPGYGSAPTLRTRNSADLDEYFQVPGGGYGLEGRIGHVGGETVGRSDSLTHLNLQPYMFVEENMLFGDLRIYRLNDGGVGGNMGGGWRRYFADHDTILGAIGYYDVDDTRSQEFQQMGLSLEMLSRWLDIRANWYIPIGDKEQILGTGFVDGSQRFFENLLLVDTTTDFGNAAEGVDVTATTPVPWKALQPYNVEASGGFYHYQVRDEKLPALWGYRARLDASFFDRILHTFVELTHDRQHDTNVIIGASLDYYGGFESRNRLTNRQFYRMSEFVRRNYNVVTIESTVVTPDVPVINPADGEPYFIVHIDNTDPPDLNNGTFENPFDLITQAFAEAAMSPQFEDVFLVHGGSTFTADEATLVVPDNTILLGENVPGRVQTLAAVGLGNLELPVANPGQGPVTLENSTGSAIDATNARLVGAFTIINPAANGLLVMGPSGIGGNQQFRDISIFGANGDGIFFDGAGGNFTLQRVTVAADDGGDGAMGRAFHVDGGNATVTALDVDSDVLTDPTLENSGGNLREIILIENTMGGTINLAGITANDHGGAAAGMGGGGIRLLNNAGNVALGPAVIDNTGLVPMIGTTPAGVGAGVEIFGGTGNTTLFGDITVTNATGVGFLVDSLMLGGVVNVAASTDIRVNNRNTIGADFRNVAGSVLFSPTLATGTVPASSLTIGPLSATPIGNGGPAIRFSASTGSVSINNISIADSNVSGILIGSAEAGGTLADQNQVTVNPDLSITRPRFVATGTTNINSTGSLANLGTAAIRIEGQPIDAATNPLGEAANVLIQGNVNINTRVDRGVQVANNSGLIQFSGQTIVDNNAGPPSDRAGLFVRDSIGTMNFGNFTVQDTIPGEPAIEIHNVPRPGTVGFTNLVINNAQGDGADVPGGDGDLTQGLGGDTTGLLVSDVASFSVTDGSIEVMDGIAVDIQRVFPQNELGQEIVRDTQNRAVVLDPATRLPIAVLDANGNPILDSMGNNVIPDVFTLSTFPGYQVNLTDVSAITTAAATSQQFGIFLANNTGTFEIQGVTGIPGSGGEISGSTVAGLFADDADRVIIRNQDYFVNNVGLSFQDMNENTQQGFLLDGIRVQDSTQEAVLAFDVRNATIEDSQFQNNGFVDLDPDPIGQLFADTIRLIVTERPDDPFISGDEDAPLSFPYTYTIVRNTFLDQNTTVGSDTINIQTGGGLGRGSLLRTFIQNNNWLTFDRGIDINDTPKLVNINWNGTIDALISGNNANLITRNSPRGFEIRQNDSDSNASQVVVTNNTIDFNNSNNAIGTFFDFVGTARIDFTNNNYDMGNGGSTGVLFRLLGESNDVEIAGNILDFGLVGNNLGSGVGVDILQVVGGAFPSSFLINGNIIGTTAADAANTAFRFQTTIGQINLFGNIENTVFANTFFNPLNNPDIVGQININGGFLP